METKFNFNSQVCTDKNQSERLLALGLKPETADCHWRLQPYYNDEGFDCGLEWSCNMGTFLQDDAHELFFDYIPAWSLHRLIEMMPEEMYGGLLCIFKDSIRYEEVIMDRLEAHFEVVGENMYENAISCIEWLIKEGYFNKQYLEE